MKLQIVSLYLLFWLYHVLYCLCLFPLSSLYPSNIFFCCPLESWFPWLVFLSLLKLLLTFILNKNLIYTSHDIFFSNIRLDYVYLWFSRINAYIAPKKNLVILIKDDLEGNQFKVNLLCIKDDIFSQYTQIFWRLI